MDQLDSAVEVLLDNLGFSRHPYRIVNSGVATSQLASRLGIDQDEARELCRQAVVDRLDGRIDVVDHGGKMKGDRPRRVEEWWVQPSK